MLIAITNYGMSTGMESEIRKITVHVPAALLESAQAETGEGITDTVRKGLELLKRQHAYRAMEKLKGKVKFKYTADQLRDDGR